MMPHKEPKKVSSRKLTNLTTFPSRPAQQKPLVLKMKRTLSIFSAWPTHKRSVALLSTQLLVKIHKASSRSSAATTNSTFCTLLLPPDGRAASSLASQRSKFLEIRKMGLSRSADPYSTDSFASALSSSSFLKVRSSRFSQDRLAKLEIL